MITPEDKAKELVMVFMNYQPIKMSDYTKIEYPSAVNLAKICVNEIILLRKDYFDCTNPINDERYWQEVKNELNKL